MSRYDSDELATGCLFAILGVFLLILFNLAYAGIGLWLWNIIVIPVFNAPILNYWQMYGLMWLFRLFVGQVSYKFNKDNN